MLQQDAENNLQICLQRFYAKRSYVQQLWLSDQNLNLAISSISINFVQPKSILLSKKDNIQSHGLTGKTEFGNEKSIELSTLFERGKKILLLGDVGVGKTTSMQWLTYQWTREQIWKKQFDYVFLIPLKNLALPKYQHSRNLLLDVLIQECIDMLDQLATKDELTDLLINDLNPSSIKASMQKTKTLIILDDIDEVLSALQNPNSVTSQFIQSITRLNRSLIMTCRSYQASFLQNLVEFDGAYINIGFREKDIEKYVVDFFSKDTEKAEQLLYVVRNQPALKLLTHTPMQLALFCHLWQNDHNQDVIINLAWFYDQLILSYLHQAEIKKGRNVYLRTRIQLYHSYQDALHFLEWLAWKMLQNSENFITPELLQQYLSENPKIDFEQLLSLGFLKTSGDIQKSVSEKIYYLPHKSLVEFLAACYVWRCLGEVELAGTIQWLRINKFKTHTQTLWKFLAGLSSLRVKQNFNKAKQKFEEFTKLVEEPINLNKLIDWQFKISILEEVYLDPKEPNGLSNIYTMLAKEIISILKNVSPFEENFLSEDGNIFERLILLLIQYPQFQKIDPSEFYNMWVFLLESTWSGLASSDSAELSQLLIKGFCLHLKFIQKSTQEGYKTILKLINPYLVYTSDKAEINIGAWYALDIILNIIPAHFDETLVKIRTLSRETTWQTSLRVCESLDTLIAVMPHKGVEVLKIAKLLFKSSSTVILRCACKSASNMLSHIPQQHEQILELVTPLLTHDSYVVVEDAWKALVTIVTVRPEKLDVMFQIIQTLLKEAKYQYSYIFENICQALKKVLEVSLQRLDDIIILLEQLLINKDALVTASALDALVKIVAIEPKKYEKIQSIIRIKIYESEGITYIKTCLELMNIIPATRIQLDKILTEIELLLKNKDHRVRIKACSLLMMASSIPSVQLKPMSGSIEYLLTDTNSEVRANATELIRAIIPLNIYSAKKILAMTKVLTKDEDREARISASKTLHTLYLANPKIFGTKLKFLLPLLKDRELKVRKNAWEIVTEMLLAEPEKLDKRLSLFHKNLQDENEPAFICAWKALAAMLETNPQRIQNIFNIIQPLLESEAISLKKKNWRQFINVISENPFILIELIRIYLRDLNTDIAVTIAKILFILSISITILTPKIIVAFEEKTYEIDFDKSRKKELLTPLIESFHREAKDREIIENISDDFSVYLTPKYSLTKQLPIPNKVFLGLLAGNIEKFNQNIKKELRFHNLRQLKDESSYHNIVYTLLRQQSKISKPESYEIRTDDDNGVNAKRADVLIIPKENTPEKTGIIIEFKHTKTLNKLETVAKNEALQQIDAKEYELTLTRCGEIKNVVKILEVGMAFCQYEVCTFFRQRDLKQKTVGPIQGPFFAKSKTVMKEEKALTMKIT